MLNLFEFLIATLKLFIAPKLLKFTWWPCARSLLLLPSVCRLVQFLTFLRVARTNDKPKTVSDWTTDESLTIRNTLIASVWSSSSAAEKAL
jgi:hypothetical protein